MQRRRGRGVGIGGLMLANQVMQIGLEHIPPATLGIAAINIALYYLSVGLTETDVCLGVPNVWYGGDYKRLFLGSFFHWNELHLAYNMGSFLWKGRTLEPRLGTVKFVWLIANMAAMAGAVSVAITVAAAHAGYPQFMRECAVGFSDVLFALKVVLTATETGHSRVSFLPFTVPTKYAAWAELLLIQLIVPRTSFIGHLSGIIVGSVWVSMVYGAWGRRLPLSLVRAWFVRAPELVATALGAVNHYRPPPPPPRQQWQQQQRYYGNGGGAYMRNGNIYR